MARERQISQKTRSRHKLERALVWVKYCSPAALTLASWFFCLIKCVRFYDGETMYSLQSVNEMVTQAIKGAASYTPGQDDSYTALLANALEPVTAIYVWSFIIAGVLSLYLLVFAVIILSGDPMAVSTNRAKLWFKTFFPGKWLVPIALILPVYPTFMPYIIRYQFFKYYVMDDLTVIMARFNPAIAVTALCAIFLTVFFVAIPFERRHKMDPFCRYDIGDDE
ncbi:MAG: hypothetical protein J6S71_10850 [Clostridia bacterium]|nr:hypothetical protein [Clostridia bacterium]